MRGLTVCRSAVALASLGAVLVAACAMAGGAAAQAPERHGKTIKQCNDELRTNAAALAQAHESPAAFIHECWWHTAGDRPTAIHGAPTAAKDGATASSSATSGAVRDPQPKTAGVAPAVAPQQPRARRTQASAQPRRAPRPLGIVRAVPSRMARRIRPGLSRLALDRGSLVPPQQRRRLVAPVEHATPVGTDPTALPLVTAVPVRIPGLGLERPIAWPVFPAFVPAFRAAVNHPIVPGFTSTP